ncbi:hypothetical protein JI721_10230 [Alicyclobacillus cycloheptanicus]|uniref:Cell division protein FtsQ n=1 Tax=Alicyclobacillus cycloheptanicus TaxID=1457 RepID=A0ABT9XMK5_9BACL|nr:hypothetical protein [Alicyclobacillus cycloheptanicus]MDQ0191549.1 hypothetical protein [Alicyclobacillus cycloheptanicus]WDM00129.1 hypothetical protein JI721_10230 [Alicyclobacillus cycloheptanicus]
MPTLETGTPIKQPTARWRPWVLPLVLCLIVLIAIGIDVARQHVRINVFGRYISADQVQSLIVERTAANAQGTTPPVTPIQSRQQILTVLRLLSHAKPVTVREDAQMQQVSQLMLTLQNQTTLQIPLDQVQHPKEVVALANGKAWRCPSSLLRYLSKLD